MKHFHSIRAQLFLCYAGILLVTIVSLFLVFYFYTVGILEKEASESLQAISTNINLSIDSEIKQMDEESKRVVSSRQITDIFFNSSVGDFTNSSFRTNLFNLLFATNPSMNYQINIFGTNNRLIQYGRTFDITVSDYRDLYPSEWFEDCIALEGKKQISGIHKNHAGYQVISLSRAISKSFSLNAPYNSIVEIQQYYQVFQNLILNAFPSSAAAKAYVYNTSGELIYPLDSGEDSSAPLYLQLVNQASETSGSLSLKDQDEILSYSKSDSTKWTVIVAESERNLLKPVFQFRNQIVGMGFVFILLTMAATFLIARQLTIPIQKIRNSIAQLNLVALPDQRLPADKPMSSELELLYDSYSEMIQRLQRSLDDIVMVRSHEIQARMLALQAQMNPHFLYNTITAISITAENNHQPEIVKMCESLSGMLRYVVSESTKPVTLSAELDYLEQYLVLMKCRFPDQIHIKIQIPPEMLNLYVPKLVVQPIVENAFKYAFNKRPPWEISIRGELNDRQWLLSFADNGVGFDREVLEWLQVKIREESFQFIQDGHERTGLLNIFYRLKILYQKDAIFKIENNLPNGSIVTVGGLLSPPGDDQERKWHDDQG